MQNRKAALARTILCSLILVASTSNYYNQPAFSEQNSLLPKSVKDFHKLNSAKLVQAFKDASNEDLQASVKKLVNDRSMSSGDWQKLFLVLMETMCESYQDQDHPYHALCAEVHQACDRRFGKNTIESDMGNLLYAESFILVDEGRKSWDEYDKAVRSGRIANSNPDFLVKSLKALGVTFGENIYGSDAIHAFQLADQFIATHKVSLPVQANLYSAATEAIYCHSFSSPDYTDSLFMKFADKAIALNRRLGPKNADLLNNVLGFKNAHISRAKESSMKTKRFEQRQRAYQRSLRKSKTK